VQSTRGVSVETFLEYVRTSNVEAIETALRQSAYDIDSQDDVSTCCICLQQVESPTCHCQLAHWPSGPRKIQHVTPTSQLADSEIDSQTTKSNRRLLNCASLSNTFGEVTGVVGEMSVKRVYAVPQCTERAPVVTSSQRPTRPDTTKPFSRVASASTV